jgi:hypothetical protein
MTVAFGNRSLAISLSVALFATFLGVHSSANAQKADTTKSTSKSSDTETVDRSANQVKADYKGIVGLGLIGAELGLVIPTVCGLDETWSLIVFPILGAGGGAAAGYFLLEKGDGHPTAAVAVMTAGIALVIPAAVLTIWATSYRPEEEPTGKPSEFAVKVQAKRSSARQQAQAAGPGLVRWSPGRVFLGAPAITPAFYGASQSDKGFVLPARSEVKVALLSGRF